MLGHELRNPLRRSSTRAAPDAAAAPPTGRATGRSTSSSGRSTPPGAAGRRPARRLAHHPRQDRAAQGARRAGRRGRRAARSRWPARCSSSARPRADASTCRRAGCRSTPTRTRLAQVVSNLLTNAAKYTDAGGHDRRSRAAPRGRRGGDLRVRDDGIGIPPEMLRAGLRPLRPGSRSRCERAEGGLGIGLTLVRSLVELHGGTRRRASSDGPGRGSEFDGPAARAASRRPAHAAAARAWPAPRSAGAPARRVLVVDDNVDAAETLAERARDARPRGATWRTTAPAALAAAAARSARTSCSLDIGLPVMDGYEVARRLRALPRSAAGLRLVALTGYGQEADRRRVARGRLRRATWSSRSTSRR